MDRTGRARKVAVQVVQGRQFAAEFIKINKAPGQETIGITVRIAEMAQQQASHEG